MTDRQLSSNCPLSLKHVKILETRYSEVSFSARIDVDNVTVLYPPSVNIPMMTFALNHEDYVDKTKDLYIICEHGVRSVALIDVMESLYDNLINVTGGTEYYARYYPLEEYKKGERHGH